MGYCRLHFKHPRPERSGNLQGVRPSVLLKYICLNADYVVLQNLWGLSPLIVARRLKPGTPTCRVLEKSRSTMARTSARR